MAGVGTTTEDLAEFLAEHHLVGAGLRREGKAPARTGKTAARLTSKIIRLQLKRFLIAICQSRDPWHACGSPRSGKRDNLARELAINMERRKAKVN